MERINDRVSDGQKRDGKVNHELAGEQQKMHTNDHINYGHEQANDERRAGTIGWSERYTRMTRSATYMSEYING